MPRFRVWLVATASTSQDVEAETSEDAADSWEHPGGLCHHCASRFDIGDWDVDEVTEDES